MINYNGHLLSSEAPVAGAQNRGLRYGDGLFETMKVIGGRVLLKDYHAERLFGSMKMLGFDPPSSINPASLMQRVTDLCQVNKLEDLARARVNVFRGEAPVGDKGDREPNILIEATPLSFPKNKMGTNQLHLTLFTDGRKAIDKFSNLKTNNYLLYQMASRYAWQMGATDSLLLNSREEVCESTVANVFLVKNNVIYTPPLSEGCVAGVMRRYLLENFPLHGLTFIEQPLKVSFFEEADEIFLSNAIQGIRPADSFLGRALDRRFSKKLLDLFFQK
jgi:branched-chain amino acid aminotransferase